jgi:acyl carrier protein phosphodiesterase
LNGRPRFSITEVRDLPYEQLLERAWGLLEPYQAPGGDESVGQRQARIDRTLDELPDVYAWLLQCWSWCSHWLDGYAEMEGTRSSAYKQMRQRRDAMDAAAKAAKLRYDGTSRVLTSLANSREFSVLPRGRDTDA